MDESTRRISMRSVLALVAVVAVAAVVWAASALAADGSGTSGGDGGARDSPTIANVQSGDGARDGDCPNRDGESRTSADI